jgi:hypothetical protein
MAPRVKTIKVGTVIPLKITRENIDESTPCDKGTCMATLSGIQTLESRFGKQNYRVRSTNHGMTFRINGYDVLTVFDHQTSHNIYQYDEIYRRTKSIAKARASVKPFKAKLMVESCQKAPIYPAMSEATKKDLASRPRRKVVVKSGIKMSNRRQLSE